MKGDDHASRFRKARPHRDRGSRDQAQGEEHRGRAAESQPKRSDSMSDDQPTRKTTSSRPAEKKLAVGANALGLYTSFKLIFRWASRPAYVRNSIWTASSAMISRM